MSKRSQHEIRLSDLTDGVLGRLVRAGLIAVHLDGQERRITEARAIAQQRQQRDLAIRQDRREYVHEHTDLLVQPEVQIRDVLVPALDVREKVLGEVAPSAARSPYNRARHRIGDGLLDAETTTWQTLLAEHMRLLKLAPTLGKSEPVMQVATAITAVVNASDPVRRRKVQALIDNLGCSEQYAEALMTRLEAK